MAEKKAVGKITHFFPKINVAVLKADSTIKKGDKVTIEGHGNKLEMTIESMQVEHKEVEECKPGEEVGLKVPKEVKEGDFVFKT